MAYKLLVLPRSFFSEQKGGNLILAFSVNLQDQGSDFESLLRSKYVACASLNALSLYLERTFNI